MTVYSYGQLEQLWINAGGSKELAPLAAAIAEAESGGRSDAQNDNDSNGQGGTQTSWGLWQISNGTHNQPVPGILSPGTNAQQAVTKYKASGWAPWGTYTSGAYQAYLSNSTPPDPNVTAAAGADWWIVGYAGFSNGKAIGGAVYVQAPDAAAASAKAKTLIPPGANAGPPIGPYTSKANATQSVTALQNADGGGAAAAGCLISAPSLNLVVTSVGGGCIFTKSEARALIGGLLLGVGALIILPGLIVLAVSGFGAAGGGQAVSGTASALGKVPGYGRAFRAVT
jgi:hypothetical protein